MYNTYKVEYNTLSRDNIPHSCRITNNTSSKVLLHTIYFVFKTYITYYYQRVSRVNNITLYIRLFIVYTIVSSNILYYTIVYRHKTRV